MLSQSDKIAVDNWEDIKARNSQTPALMFYDGKLSDNDIHDYAEKTLKYGQFRFSNSISIDSSFLTSSKILPKVLNREAVIWTLALP